MTLTFQIRPLLRRSFWLLAFVLFACGEQYGGEESEAPLEESGYETESYDQAEKVADGLQTAPGAEMDFSFVNEPIKQDKALLLMRTGNLAVKTDDPIAARAEVKQMVEKVGGYLTGDRQDQTERNLTVEMIVRVPADKFDGLIEGIRGLEGKLESIDVQSQDVTEEYVDVATRLRTKRQVLEKYEGFLKNAKNVEEVLNVEREIRVLQEEIEAAEGRLRFLQDRVRFATLTIRLYKDYPYTYEPGEADGFGDKLMRGADWGWQGVKALVLIVVTLWPLWLIGAVIWYLVARSIKRGKAKKAQQNPANSAGESAHSS